MKLMNEKTADNERLGAYNLTVEANDGKIFRYLIDPSGYLASYGSCLNSINFKPITGGIKAFDDKIINRMKCDKKIIEETDGRSWPFENLIGKYFDNEGIPYRVIDDELFPSIHTSKYLGKIFNEI